MASQPDSSPPDSKAQSPNTTYSNNTGVASLANNSDTDSVTHSSRGFSRARLASFDDDTIPTLVTSHSGGYEVADFSEMASNNKRSDDDDVNLTPATLSFKQHADGVKVIELKSPGQGYDGGNVAILIIEGHTPGVTPSEEKYEIDLAMMTNTDSQDSDQNVWIAPFSDADDLDSDSEENRGMASEGVVEKAVMSAEVVKEEAERHHLAFMASLSPAQRLMDAAVKVQAVVKFTRMQRLKKRARWLTKKFIVFVLSHVGLTSLVGLYAVAGGFIFQHLESRIGFHANDTMKSYRLQHVEDLWNQTLKLNVLRQDVWKKMANDHLKIFEKEIYKAIIQEHWNDPDDYHPGQTTEWTYPSALLFAITVITTIGYGDIALQTDEAKVICMLYATVGIPLTLLCLANIGSFLATVYRFTWKHLHHLTLVIVRAPERNKPLVDTSDVRVPISVSVITMVVYILGGAAIFSRWENWTFLEGSYFCFITLSTIGFGDYVPGQDTETLDHNAKRVVCALYLLFGLALLSMIFQLIQDSVTIVVRRYASFMGLTEAQIERDIQESDEEEEGTGGKNNLEEMVKSTVIKVNADGGATISNGKECLPQESEYLTDDSSLSKTRNRFREILVDTGKLHRAGTFPMRKQENKTPSTLTVSRLCSVPEEELSRRGSSVKLDDSNDSPEATTGAVDLESVRDILYKKYTILPNTTSEDQPVNKDVD